MNRAFKGVWIPKSIWINTELTWMEKLFIVEIDSLDNKDGCFASNKYFASFFNLSAGRCSQIINDLKKKKYISIHYVKKDKVIEKRVIRILNTPIKNTKGGGIKNTKGGYLEYDEDNNTFINNTSHINNTPDSIESLSIFCPYCFEKNIVTKEYGLLSCKRCHEEPFAKAYKSEKTIIKICKDMNKNYKYYTLAELLYKKHLESDDKFLAGKDLVKIFLRWANDIRLLCETDKRDRGLVKNVIIWCQQHEGNNGFSWKNNILSGFKLRKQFSNLYGQYMQQIKKSDKFNGYREPAIRIIKYLDAKTRFNAEKFPNYNMPELPKFDGINEALTYPITILKKGKTEAECKYVIDTMCSHWKFDPKMREFLRPSTLFNPAKFQGYLSKQKKPPWVTHNEGATWQWEYVE